ncbi:MAG: DUF2071 domain-containing protein [Planctomycetes bacterium]|nr:DUF2071 domain-containing protein [Planctomycetota bacterium]MCB9902847.1 DUF2071 domain-containing protein [Planctomycetota bacterium]
MRWHDLAFLHWRVDADVLRRHIPAELQLDTFDGAAWLGVVPFRMSHVGPRWVPPIPGVHAFPELNLRTYVTADGKPGVWFFSLDVTKRFAVWAARTFFHLPYFRAEMRFERDGDAIRYASERGVERFGFTGRYRPTGDVYLSQPGTLESWLTERYCLYAADSRGRVFRGEIHHAPWPLQRAEVEVEQNTLCRQVGIDALEGEPLAHFVRELDVVAWLLE